MRNIWSVRLLSRSVAGKRLVETEKTSACVVVHCKLCKSEIAVYGLYLNVIKGECATQLLKNPIIQTRICLISGVYHKTHHILVSEVGGSCHIGFFRSGYAHEYVTTGVRSGRFTRIIGFKSALRSYSNVL
jgi:hypothetical protein